MTERLRVVRHLKPFIYNSQTIFTCKKPATLHCEGFVLKTEKAVSISSSQSIEGADDKQYSKNHNDERPYFQCCRNEFSLLKQPYRSSEYNDKADSYANDHTASRNAEAFVLLFRARFSTASSSETFVLVSLTLFALLRQVQRGATLRACLGAFRVLRSAFRAIDHFWVLLPTPSSVRCFKIFGASARGIGLSNLRLLFEA